MNDFACGLFLNLIYMSVCMMPIFVCLEPQYGSRENIAAASCYLWVIMVSAEALLHVSHDIFFAVRGIFIFLFFVVLFIFFRGDLIKKAFLYSSAGLFVLLGTSLNELAVWIFRGKGGLTDSQIRVIVSFGAACGYYIMVRFWLKDRVNRLFEQLSVRNAALLFSFPSAFLLVLFIGSHTVFSSDTLLQRGPGDILFFLCLCAMILVLYIMTLNTTLEILDRKKTEEELQFARQLIAKQREHYNQTLDYMEQVRIIRHDFRHHVHALLHMDKEEERRYLRKLQEELDTAAETAFCQNQAVNGLLNEYAARAEKAQISFSAQLDLSSHVPVDDLTLCIVIGNLLENAMEACGRMKDGKFIRLQARWTEDHLMMLVENSYCGQIRQRDGKLLSSKKDGGLGILSIRRILNQPGDEFDMDYDGSVFTSMVKIVARCAV
ncbi:MAG: GHKL domain-containing protein [Enterocloster sp.]